MEILKERNLVFMVLSDNRFSYVKLLIFENIMGGGYPEHREEGMRPSKVLTAVRDGGSNQAQHLSVERFVHMPEGGPTCGTSSKPQVTTSAMQECASAGRQDGPAGNALEIRSIRSPQRHEAFSWATETPKAS